MRPILVAAIVMLAGGHSIANGHVEQSRSPVARRAGTDGGARIERGRLAAGDETLETGEYADVFTVNGRRNQRLTIELVSEDFDAYLVLIPPRGEQKENDDYDDDTSRSVIRTVLDEPGEYKVLVTSYEEGETGDYELKISLEADSGGRPGASAARETAIGFGQARNGELTDNDGQLDDEKFRDVYVLDGRRGDRLVVELSSRDFDPFLILTPPSGVEIDNDDADGRQDLSRIELTLRENGRYRITATSYEAGETGRYRVVLHSGGTAAAASGGERPPRSGSETDPRSGGRIFGLFVGISDYGDPDNDLEYTADDARRLHEAMVRGAGMRPSDGIVIIDREATRANVRRAFEDVAGRAGPEDLFVFFFSGHGDRIRRNGRQPADPDGFDESISLRDGDVTDDEMNGWFAAVRARVSLLVLDSCFAGGFSKDVISAPRRMGLFSSEEDVQSGVAEKFRAGGYLAKFIAEAVGEQRADEDRNGDITAVELSQYLHERYRRDVKSRPDDDDTYVRLGGPQIGYQHLVVDRGGVGPYDVLFGR